MTQFENASATQTNVEEMFSDHTRPSIRRKCQICFTFESSSDSDESTVARENALTDIGMGKKELKCLKIRGLSQ